jgi:outer membrane receptor protein involved in Fe transport
MVRRLVGRFSRPVRLSVMLGLAAAVGYMPADLLAQDGRVAGRVVSAANNAPIGVAQISISGTSLGGVTSDDGRFLILNVPAGSREIVVQRIGFRTERQTVEVRAGQVTVANFSLAETAVELEEVVVTGTPGVSSRREVGNSVASVKTATIEYAPSQTLSSILNGQTAGLQQFQQEGQVGGGSKIILRGLNSVTQDVQPLIYVDGVRMNNNQGIAGNRQSMNPGPAGAQTSSNPLDAINPDDIERVEIVRGSAATTLYGTEAAGGVIQIFTKRGREGQEAAWAAEVTTGIRKMTANNMGPVLGGTDDWGLTKPWYKNGPLGELNLSVSGGTASLRYFMSGSATYDDGVIDNNDARSYGIRGNFGIRPLTSLRIDLNTAYNHSETNYMEMGDNATGFMLNVLRGDQDYTNAAVNRDNFTGDPDQVLFDITNIGTNEHVVGGLTVTHTPDFANLTTRMTVGLDYTSAFNRQQIPFDHVLQPRGFRNINEWEHRTVTLDLASTWAFDINDNISSSFSAGGQVFNDWDHTTFATSEDFGGPGEKTISSGATRRSDETLLKITNAGFFAQEVLGFWDQLFITAGLRVDGNSAFGEDLGLQAYPKLSASYVVSDLDAWPQEWWPVMKIRAAWGESGKAPGAFDAVRTWDPVSGLEGLAGVTPANLGNADLGPERTSEIEFGFEGSMLSDRIGFDATYYKSTTNDALLPVTAPPSEGFLTAQLKNVGKFENSGIELSVTGVPIDLDNLRWEITGRYTKQDSEVLDLGEAPEFFLGFSALGQWVREGYPIVSLWGQRVTNPNEIADPVITPDDEYYGPVYPTRIMGFSTTLNLWRRLSIYALGEYQGGQYQFNIMPWQQVRRGLWPECNAQEPLNSAPAIWRARCEQPTPNFDFWMRESDFFKLRTISASLQLPDNLIPGATGTTATFSVQNLYKWTNAAGIDPELTVGYDQGVGQFPARYEYYQLPSPTMFSFSLRTNF